jgi:hypothetical protein
MSIKEEEENAEGVMSDNCVYMRANACLSCWIASDFTCCEHSDDDFMVCII